MESKIKEFDKVIRCLALELPEPVWDDVDKHWQELKTELEKPATNTGSTSCLGCANAIDDCANGENFVCKECSRFYTSKWVA
jgi:hypothetical protein